MQVFGKVRQGQKEVPKQYPVGDVLKVAQRYLSDKSHTETGERWGTFFKARRCPDGLTRFICRHCSTPLLPGRNPSLTLNGHHDKCDKDLVVFPAIMGGQQGPSGRANPGDEGDSLSVYILRKLIE